MSKILEKFLKYVSFDTQSDEESMSSPSTKKQKLLGAYLVKELKKYGVKNAYLDNYGYVYGKIASNINSDVTLGLIAHMDTSPDASGKDVKPQLVEYKEGNIFNHEETRTRKLLLHKKEILKLNDKIRIEGYTLIPLKMYFVKNKVKVLLGICKGKKLYDKRETIKKRDMERELRQKMKGE